MLRKKEFSIKLSDLIIIGYCTKIIECGDNIQQKT